MIITTQLRRVTLFALGVLVVKSLKLLLSNSFLQPSTALVLLALLVGVILGSWLWDLQYLVRGVANSPQLKPTNLTELKRWLILSWQENWSDRSFYNPFESLFFLLIWLGILFFPLAFPNWSLTIGLISGFNYRLMAKVLSYLKKGYPPHFFIFLRRRPPQNQLHYFLVVWLFMAGLLNLLFI